jgi:Rrf2 family protein
MKITSQEEYGLRCLLRLARHEGTEPLTVSAIAEAESLSVPYVGKLMGALRQAGLVDSVRGRGGGYALTRPPDQITVIHALQGLGGHLFASGFCDTHGGASDSCVHLGDCSIRSLWGVLGLLVDRVLGQTTLADLVRAGRPCDSVRLLENQLSTLMDRAEGTGPFAVGRRSDLVPLAVPPRKTP